MARDHSLSEESASCLHRSKPSGKTAGCERGGDLQISLAVGRRQNGLLPHVTGYEYPSTCVSYIPASEISKALDCQQSNKADVVCEFDKYDAHSKNDHSSKVVSSIAIGLDDTIWKVSMVQCPSGHVTRDILSCDTQGQCGVKTVYDVVSIGRRHNVHVVCERHRETLHLHSVCDHINTARTTQMKIFVSMSFVRFIC